MNTKDDDLAAAKRTMDAAIKASETVGSVTEAVCGDALTRFGLPLVGGLMAAAVGARVAELSLLKGAAMLLKESERAEGSARFKAQVDEIAEAIMANSMEVSLTEPPR